MAKVLFVQNVIAGYYSENQGVMQLSSMLKKHGHECKLVVGKEKEILDKLLEYNPDIIALSTTFSDQTWAIEISKTIKKNSKAKVLIGGAVVFSNPDLIKNKFVDAMVIGEGEEAIVEIANRAMNKKDITSTINTLTYENGSIIRNKQIGYVENLDKLPFPDREIYNIDTPYKVHTSSTKSFMATRGCPYKCSFCFYSTLKNKYQYPERTRRRSPKNIIEEIKVEKEKNSLKKIRFQDSLFTSNKEWVMEVLKEYRKQINIPFICNGHYNYLDEEVIRELKKANCSLVNIGTESGDEKIRNGMFHKHVSTKRIMKVSKLLHKHKLRFAALNIMGTPGETFEQAIKTIKLNQKIKPDSVTVNMLINYPETTITNYALKNNYLTKNKLNELSQEKNKRMRSLLKNKEGRKISNLQKLSGILIMYPFLKPIILQLVKLPENKVFDYIYYLSHINQMRRINIFGGIESIERVLRFTIHHILRIVQKPFSMIKLNSLKTSG